VEVGQAGEYLRSDDRVLENGYGARNDGWRTECWERAAFMGGRSFGGEEGGA